MKVILIIFSLFFTIHLIAQNCNDDTHSTNPTDSWLSCTVSANPNGARGNSHWILYDLGTSYTINNTHMWNYNVTGQTNKGMMDIAIDYSSNGTTWSQATTFQLPQAPGNSSYTGVPGPDLNGITARYILITALSTHGHTCAGISEVKFYITPSSCYNNLTHPILPTVENGIADYESDTYIVSEATVHATARVDYDATTHIVLNPGFKVEAGAVFNAFIDGCNNGGGGSNSRQQESDQN